MHDLIRYIRKNKKRLVKIALMIALLIGLLQLLNYLAKNNSNHIGTSTDKNIYDRTNGTVVSNKSAVSGSGISSSKIESVNDTIETFVAFCNNNNTQKAYNMLSDACKEALYPNLENFVLDYYNALFEGNERTYTIENWIGNTYIVRFTLDILATGKSANESTYQDYITVESTSDGNKLNVNQYIGKEELNKSADSDNIQMTVLYREKYMDYEIYKIQVTNNTEGTILLDQLLETDDIYLKDSNDTKHIAFSNEMVQDDLKIYAGHTSMIEIKFDNPYIMNRKIKSLCFSHLVLNYSESNKDVFDEIKYSISF